MGQLKLNFILNNDNLGIHIRDINLLLQIKFPLWEYNSIQIILE